MYIFAVCLLSSFLTSHGWYIGKNVIYEYTFERSLSVDSVRNFMETAVLQFRWETNEIITARLRSLGWKHRPKIVPNSALLDRGVTFQAVFRAGQVTDLKVPSDATKWQIEYIRGVVGLLQVSNRFEKEHEFSLTEESVAGKCKTRYSVKRNSTYDVITKTNDYTKCREMAVFRKGIYGAYFADALIRKRNILARDTKTVITFDKNRKVITNSIAVEIIHIHSLNNKTEFIAVSSLDKKLPIGFNIPAKESDFRIDNLISAEGLMYRPKHQVILCHEGAIMVDWDQFDKYCVYDYYMIPQELDMTHVGSKVQMVNRLVRRIARELQTPNQIPELNTLDTFTVLVGVMRQMNFTHLKEVSEMWNDVVGYNTTFVFQNALVQAGTLETLKMIRYLKKENKFGVGKYPLEKMPEKVDSITLEYINELYEFATNRTLMRTDYDFSEKLILALSNLLRRWIIGNKKSVDPKQLNNSTREKYTWYFSTKLKESLNKKLDNKFGIHLQALDNMGDLMNFNDYFAGENMMYYLKKADFVEAMDKTLTVFPEGSRDFLLSLLKDQNEHGHVRAVAIPQLFKTGLPRHTYREIIRLGEESGNDYEVRLAAKTLRSRSMNGKIPYHFLHEEEDVFNSSFQCAPLTGHISNHLRRFLLLSHVFLDSRYEDTANIDYLGYFAKLLTNFFYTKLINIPTDQDPRAPRIKRYKESWLLSNEVSFGFPTENGFPFLYSHRSPDFISIDDTARGKDYLRVDYHLIWSRQDQIKMGFVNPLTGEYYVKGVHVNKHLNYPVAIYRTPAGSPNIKITIDPLFREWNQRIVHFATLPYVGIGHLFPVVPTVEDNDIIFTKPENLTKEEVFLDEAKMFRINYNSSGNYSILKEINLLPCSGPFGEATFAYSSLNAYFSEHPSNLTSLIIQPKFRDDVPDIDACTGNINPARMLPSGAPHILEADFSLLGPANYSLYLELRYSIDVDYKNTKITAKGSFAKNNFLMYQACSNVVFQQKKKAIIDWWSWFGYKTGSVSWKLNYGPNCKHGATVSAESDIDLHGLKWDSDIYLNAKMDFDNVSCKTAETICGLRQDILPGKAPGFIVRFFPQYRTKCEYINKFKHRCS